MIRSENHQLKVRDHDHLGLNVDGNSPGYTNFRGASCVRCSLSLKAPYFVPVVLHNCKGFDSHLIMLAIRKHKDKKKLHVFPITWRSIFLFYLDS